MKKISKLKFITFLIIYLELLTKIFITKSFDGIIYTLIFSLPIILGLYLITNISTKKINTIITYLLTIIISIYYIFEVMFYRLFNTIFSFSSINMAGNVLDFKDIALSVIKNNIPIIILYLIPLIILIILHKKISFTRSSKKYLGMSAGYLILIHLFCLLSILINKNSIYSAYNLYYNINSGFKTVSKFGLASYTRIDIKRVIFGFNENIITINPTIEPLPIDEPKPPEEIQYNDNIEDIDFDNLINNETNKNIIDTLNYLKNSNPTKQNKYTGLFKDKNLIFILAEGFNTIAIDKELTPTLYRLTNNGIKFNNFYSPLFMSTTGGEFQATTGLLPTQETLNTWKKNTPIISYALGNSFSNIGYQTQSYHNWNYNYYNRQKTMPTQGFNDYLACKNGLEKLINCNWLPSDIEMFNTTLPLYENKEKFVTYYISVSGHAPYVYNSDGNSIALKNKDLVKNLPYSNNVKAYLATQIEFDRALEALINNLDEAGILDDTVISFVGDHYPYTLTLNEINELSTYVRDENFEIHHSEFIIWNNKMEPVTIDKVGSEIDCLPTLLNLFGVTYDSRLIMGKDLLSDTPGLAIFEDRSWITEYCSYINGKLIPKKNIENEEEYINSINQEVSNRFTISNNMIKYNMYEYILK